MVANLRLQSHLQGWMLETTPILRYSIWAKELQSHLRGLVLETRYPDLRDDEDLLLQSHLQGLMLETSLRIRPPLKPSPRFGSETMVAFTSVRCKAFSRAWYWRRPRVVSHQRLLQSHLQGWMLETRANAMSGRFRDNPVAKPSPGFVAGDPRISRPTAREADPLQSLLQGSMLETMRSPVSSSVAKPSLRLGIGDHMRFRLTVASSCVAKPSPGLGTGDHGTSEKCLCLLSGLQSHLQGWMLETRANAMSGRFRDNHVAKPSPGLGIGDHRRQ